MLIGFICNAQVINFPDANFRGKLLNGHSASTENVNSQEFPVYGNFITADTNHNGQIEVVEAQSITCLILDNSGILDLSGIEYFTNLQMLVVPYNYLTNIDLSNLVNLKYLFVDYNLLTSLLVNSSTNLIELNCEGNQISNIYLTEFTNLEYLNVSRNLLSTLDLNGLNHLKFVSCEYNQITALDFTGFSDLIVAKCNNNLIETLDFSTNPVNAILMCHSNPNLTSICIKNDFSNETYGGISDILSNNIHLSYICADDFEINNLQTNLISSSLTQPVTINSACNLSKENFNNDKVAFYPNPTSSIVNIKNKSNIKSVVLYDTLGRILLNKEINQSNFVLDISNQNKGVYLLKVVTENGSSIEKIIKE